MASTVPEKLQPLNNYLQSNLKWKNYRSGRSSLAGEASSSSNPWLESPPLRLHTHAPYSPHYRHTSPSNAFRRPSPLHKESAGHDSEVEADRNYGGSKFINRTSKRKISELGSKSDDYDNKRKRSNEISIRLRENSKQHDAAGEENHTSTDDSVWQTAADRNYAGFRFIERTNKLKISELSTKSDDYDSKRKRSNEICIPLRENSKQNDAVTEENHTSTPIDDESSPKIWNLRPRRLPVNHKQSAGGFPTIGTSRLPENKTSGGKLSELNNNCNVDMTTTRLPVISISLPRGEIEADLSFLTGSKPSRRPKKRPKAIQKQLDNLFPGLWLDSISVDSYKVSETPSKG